MDKRSLYYVWNQEETPVVLRRTGKGEQLRLKLPFALGNRQWLQNGRRRKPEWIGENGYWEIPKAWFNDFVDRSLAKYGRVYIIQPYRVQEKCASACRNAAGHECQCSCMGVHHGVGDDGSWFDVSDTFATRWNDRELACRLLIRR